MSNVSGLMFSHPNKATKYISKSIIGAQRYDLLYHCTTTDALFSIIESREFWMRNLQTVNDEEEGHRISLPEYEKSFFVASFTYMDDVDESHWREYASMEDGILFSVSKSWFMKAVSSNVRKKGS